MDRTRDMTAGSPARHILGFALPLVLTNIGQQLYFIADASIVGRGLGVKALAAVGTTDWYCWLIVWTMIALTQAVSTYVSRSFGEKDYEGMNRAIAACAALCFGLSLVVTAAGLAAASPALRLLGTPEELFDGALLYLMIIVGGTPVVALYNMAASVLRAVGDGKTPLIAMIIAAAMNIGLDLLFVFVFRWGIAGAAAASVLAQVFSFLYCLRRLAMTEAVDFGSMSLAGNARLIWEMLVFALPVAVEYIIIGVSGIIVQSEINAQGSLFIAGYTAPNKLYGLMESSAISLGLASSTFLAQNYGAGEYERVKRGLGDSCLLSVLISLAVTAFVIILRRPLIGLFLNPGEAGGAEAVEIAVYYLSVMAAGLSVLYLIYVFRNALQAMGISLWSMVSGIVECAVRVLMAKLVINYIGTDALFLAEPAAWITALLGVLIPYLCLRKRLLRL